MKITKILLTLALAGNMLPALAQDTYWPLDGNKKLNTSNNSVISITGNEIPLDYPVRAPRTVFNNNGAVLFNYGEYYSGMLFAGIGFSSNNARQAFAIPGSCNKYGVVDFGGVSAPHGNYLTYSTVDVTGVTNDINTTNIPSQSSLTYLHYAASAVYYSAIAGKLNPDGTRYLYYMNNEPGSWYNTLYRYTIDFYGNINTTPVTLNNSLPQGGGSMKISRDGRSIAYVNASSNVVTYDIPSNTAITYTGVTIGSGLTGGLEQVTIGTSRRWYISTGSSMGYITEGGGYTQVHTSWGIHSDLVLGANGFMYFAQGDPATASGQLYRFNPASGFFSPSIVNGALIAGKNWNNTCYSFGNQVAGENTNSFSIGSIGTPTISVNGNTSGTLFDVLDCKPIILANASGTVGSYFKITIYENDPVNQISIFRDETGNVYGTFTSVDLRFLNTLSPQSNNWLGNHTGEYTIIVSYYSPCSGTQYAYKDIRINAGPVASMGIQTNYKRKQTPTSPLTSHSYPVNSYDLTDANNTNTPYNPQIVGRNSTSFDISSNTGVTTAGQICSLVAHIDQWDWTDSTWIIDTIPPTPYTGDCQTLSMPTLLMSDFVDSVYNSWFTDPSKVPDNTISRLRVDLINECGTLTRAVVFKVVQKTFPGAYWRVAGVEEGSVRFAPVPFSGSVSPLIDLGADSRVSLTILSIDGRVMAAPYKDALLPAGSNTVSIATDSWPAGVYLYQCTIDGRKYNGKIMKQ